MPIVDASAAARGTCACSAASRGASGRRARSRWWYHLLPLLVAGLHVRMPARCLREPRSLRAFMQGIVIPIAPESRQRNVVFRLDLGQTARRLVPSTTQAESEPSPMGRLLGNGVPQEAITRQDARRRRCVARFATARGSAQERALSGDFHLIEQRSGSRKRGCPDCFGKLIDECSQRLPLFGGRKLASATSAASA